MSWRDAEPDRNTDTPGRVLAVLLIACGLAVVLGSVSPWIRYFFFVWNDIGGMEGDWGQTTLVLGAVGAVLAALRIIVRSHWLTASSVVALAAAGGLGCIKWADLNGLMADYRATTDDPLTLEVGWGLQMVTIAGFAALTISVLFLFGAALLSPSNDDEEDYEGDFADDFEEDALRPASRPRRHRALNAHSARRPPG